MKIIFPILLLLSLSQTTQAQIAFRIGSDSTDSGRDLSLDKDGNIIIAGSFGGTVDFDPGPGIHNLTSTGSADNFIAKYSATGIFKWAIKFGSVGADAPTAISIDTSGNIYICGYISGTTDFDPGAGTAIKTTNGLKDAYLAKYDSSGNYIWASTFGSVSDDIAYDLKTANDGSVYMVGVFQGVVDFDPGAGIYNLTSRGGEDIFVSKYNTNGDYQWAFNTGTVNDDEGLAIAVDKTGYCYISGFMWRDEVIPKGSAKTIYGPTNNTDIFLTKCSYAGDIIWEKKMGGQGINRTALHGIAIDFTGNIYITGGFSNTVDFDPGIHTANLTSHGSEDIFVAKYSSQGVYQLCIGMGGAAQDRGCGISVGKDGNIYLSGWFQGAADFDPSPGVYTVNSFGTGGATDIFVAEYNFQGDFIWINDIGSPVSGADYASNANSIIVDKLKNCYVTGQFFGTCNFDPKSTPDNLSSAGLSDFFVAKYNGMGALCRNIPAFSVSPATIDFGNVSVGSILEIGFLVYNAGDGLLEISSVTSDNSSFTVTPSSAVVEPFSYKQFVTIFTPPELGSQSGNMVFLHNAGTVKDTVKLKGNGYGLEATVSTDVSPGWNMISVPVFVADSRKNVLFPSAKSNAFAFSASSYVIKDTLKTITGYWMKFDSTQTFSLTGLAKNLDTIYVKSGWNMIGSISFPVLTSSIVQDPSGIVKSKYFAYTGLYTEATTLIPGKGYWIKVDQAGKLILQAQ